MRLRLAALAACVAFPAYAQQPQIQLPGTVGVTAYDVGSGGYNQAVAIGNALKQHLNVNLRILPGRNDVARQAPVRDGRVPMSFHGVGTYFSQEGVFEFASRDWGPQPVRILLLNNSDQILTIATAADANIQTMRDLRGKRVVYVAGAPALNANVEAVMAAVGLTWNDVQRVQFGGYGPAMQGIINGQADAGWASSISGPLFQLEASPRGLRYPTFPHSDTEAWARLREIAPWFLPGVGREGAGITPDKPVESTTYPYPILMGYATLDEGLAYNFTRAMLAFYRDYAGAAPGNNGWALERQRFDWAVPYHPGAVRALREAGAWKDEHDAHNQALIRRQEVLADAWRRYAQGAPQEAAAFAEGWMRARAEALRAANLPVVFEK
ncbi:TAXI family TRAP transporter solute-binding subunit [Crenalkalicoccus roseus]|uniref:TAXI family TRAP transporter solute-binding subunit n=1 Tax=Crenalkalicoccus roseus TaxID=1485588 RepID=UPI001080279C|nr:TAXI family TRAP transporter solute-binding subunit [Crenalkalicoccus roseus]